jgi:hypothetical protein
LSRSSGNCQLKLERTGCDTIKKKNYRRHANSVVDQRNRGPRRHNLVYGQTFTSLSRSADRGFASLVQPW